MTSQAQPVSKRAGPARGARGFTLLELMMVMVIIVILLGVAMPNVMSALSQQPIVMATNAVIDQAAFARTRASNDSVAYGLEVDAATDSGVVDVFAGTTPACSSINFDAPSLSHLDFKANRDFGFVGNFGPDVRVVTVTPASVSRLCFTPDGRVLDAATSLPVAADKWASYAAGELVVTLSAHVEDVPAGMVHHVIIPYSGRARFTFSTTLDDVDTASGEGGS